MPRPFSYDACECERQLAVRIVRLAVGVRVQARTRGIEVVANRLWHLDGARDDGHEALVGVLVAVVVPRLEPIHAERGRDQQDQPEDDEVEAVRSPAAKEAW